MSTRSSGPPPGSSRGGLSSRAGGGGDHQQIHISIHQEKGFDYDTAVEGLLAGVGRMKQISQAIEEEQKEQGKMINTLEDTLERARFALRRTTLRLNTAYKRAKSNHMLYLVIFAFLLFLGIYILSKVFRAGRALVGG